MSSRMHGSEEELARRACAGLGAGARVLVGGLGLGYTLRAALDALPAGASVTVCELVPAVVEWNRGPLAPLAGQPSRIRASPSRSSTWRGHPPPGKRWDAILLDVDNGPSALTRRANHVLYGATGLSVAKAALRLGGVLAIWSASPDDAFVARLHRAGFEVTVDTVPARGRAGWVASHVLFFAEPDLGASTEATSTTAVKASSATAARSGRRGSPRPTIGAAAGTSG
jgi:spermidine synthase